MVALLAIGACSDETSGPEPVVFTCDGVSMGQSLAGTATAATGNLDVRIASNNGRFTQAPTIADVSSGTLGMVTVVDGVVNIPITAVGGSVSFSLDGRLTGPEGDFCDITRSFSVTINGDDATIQ
jgi:hypothetical protein